MDPTTLSWILIVPNGLGEPALPQAWVAWGGGYSSSHGPLVGVLRHHKDRTNKRILHSDSKA